MKFKAKIMIYKNKRCFPLGVGYRPHLVKKNSNTLLGVEFICFDAYRPTNEYVDCVFQTSYPDVDYSELIEGQTYDVREGPSVVGEIKLLKLLEK